MVGWVVSCSRKTRSNIYTSGFHGQRGWYCQSNTATNCLLYSTYRKHYLELAISHMLQKYLIITHWDYFEQTIFSLIMPTNECQIKKHGNLIDFPVNQIKLMINNKHCAASNNYYNHSQPIGFYFFILINHHLSMQRNQLKNVLHNSFF